MVVGALAVVTFFDHGSSVIGLFRQPYCGSEGLSYLRVPSRTRPNI
jgi:hypothetical protein